MFIAVFLQERSLLEARGLNPVGSCWIVVLGKGYRDRCALACSKESLAMRSSFASNFWGEVLVECAL